VIASNALMVTDYEGTIRLSDSDGKMGNLIHYFEL